MAPDFMKSDLLIWIDGMTRYKIYTLPKPKLQNDNAGSKRSGVRLVGCVFVPYSELVARRLME